MVPRERPESGLPAVPAQPGSPGYQNAPEEESVDLRAAFTVLRRHALFVLAVAGVVFAGTVYLVMRQEPEYLARAMLRLQDERAAMIPQVQSEAMEQVLGKANDPLFSELEVLRSRAIGMEVLKRTPLRLVSDGKFRVGSLQEVSADPTAPADTLEVKFGEERFTIRSGDGEVQGVYGAPVQAAGMSFVIPEQPEVEETTLIALDQDRALNRLSRRLVGRQREKTDVVDVEFTSTDPQLAQQVVNATVQAFSERNARVAQESSRRRRSFVEAQLAQTDSMFADAQLALSSFRSRESVFSSREKFAAQQAGLMELEVRREELDADRGMYQALLDGLRRRGADGGRGLETLVSTPGVASNPVITQLYRQLVQYQTARDSLTSGSWGSAQSNPDVQRLNTLIASTEEKLVSAARSHLAALEARIAAMDGLRGRNEAQLQGLPGAEAEELRLVQQLEIVRKMSDVLREEYQRARVAEAVEVGQVNVVDMAALPTQPISSGRTLKLGVGLLFGLMLGGAGAFLREHLNTRIRRKEDMEELLHVPTLAVIPRLTRNGEAKRGKLQLPGRIVPVKSSNGKGVIHAGLQELVTVSDVRSSGAEAFRTLRTNLIFSQAVESLRTIVVTSATPSDGKTTTSSNLAVTFAQQGLRVLLVDCDLRRGRLHHVFGLPQSPGLTELVLGHSSLEAVMRQTPVEGLSVLTSGTLPPNPAELLAGPRTMKTLELLREQFDLVILDTAPLMAAADASVLGLRADGVLLVVRAGYTERSAAQYSMQQLRSVGARVIGAVLNDPESETQRYGGYYYTGYYGAEDTEVEVSRLAPTGVGASN